MNHKTAPDAIWLGLDVGTQSAKAMAVSDAGLTLGAGSCPLTSQRQGPRHEQDPEQWWRAVATASRAALADLPAKAVRGVAVDGTSGTILLADRAGKALTPALMYDDSRAVDETRLANQAGAAVWASLGYYRLQPSWALPKLLWLLREYPHLPSEPRLAHQADFINRRLTGHDVATDASTALKTGYNLIGECWPEEVFAALNIPQSIMPPVVRSGSQLGVVSAKAMELTGIPAGTPVIAGMTDGCAAQLGAGALSVGSWNSVLGTTLVLKGVSRELVRDPGGVLYSHRSPDGNWLPGGASSTGAGILTARFPGRDLEMLAAQAAQREPASVIAYPLAGRGERFPFTAPQAEGFVLGQEADEADLYAALLQGVAFIERLCFDYLDMLGACVTGDLSFTGGGARSRYWCQLRADILGRSARIPANAEAAVGMAVLAASTDRPLADVAARMVPAGQTIDPRPDRVHRFGQPYMRLVDELARRGWIGPGLASHAGNRVKR